MNVVEEQACLKLAHDFLGFNKENNYLCRAIISNTRKRMTELKLKTFRHYLSLLNQSTSEFLTFLSNSTIHTTFWFREPRHFDILVETIEKEEIRFPKILCLACSTGEEPYSLAFVLEDLIAQGKIDDYLIEASDIDTFSLIKARKGEYLCSGINRFPKDYSQYYDVNNGKFRIKDSIKQKIKFDRVNLLDLENYKYSQKFDFAFCRNVYIYLSYLCIKSATRQISNKLNDTGRLILGHCESIEVNAQSELTLEGNSVFVKGCTKDKQPTFRRDFARQKVVLIGGSTGAIPVIKELLTSLPSKFPPVVIVQHIEESFLSQLASEFADELKLTIGKVSKAGEVLRDSQVYFSTEPYHLNIFEKRGQLLIGYKDKHPVNGHRPSIDELFLSAAKTKGTYLNFLLTGMGGDGAQGMLELSQSFDNTCLCQDKESSVVYGMAAKAHELGAKVTDLDISGLSVELGKYCEFLHAHRDAA